MASVMCKAGIIYIALLFFIHKPGPSVASKRSKGEEGGGSFHHTLGKSQMLKMIF